MKMRVKLLAAATAVLVVTAVVAAASAKSAHTYKSTIVTGSLSTANGYPNPGGTAVVAGTLKLTGFGDGAVVDKLKITGHPQPNVFAFAGTEVDYLATGTWRSTYSGTSTVQSDGSQAIDVTGRFAGGTGPYKRAKGTYHFTGTVPSGSTVLSGHSTGSLTY
jgi:hypothetical protein